MSLRLRSLGPLFWLSLALSCGHDSSPDAVSVQPVPTKSSNSQEPEAHDARAHRPDRTFDAGPFEVEITGEGPAIVFIPGLTCGAHVWDPTVEALRDRYELHVLTISGFAGRPPIEGPLLPRVRERLARYVEALDRPVVVGHSIGGFLALWLAATEPDRVGAVVAVDGLPSLAAASGIAPGAVSEVAAQMRGSVESQGPEAFAEQIERNLRMQITNPEDVARVARISGRSDPASVGRAMEELLVRDLRPLMSDIEVPVLLMGPGVGPDALRARTEAVYREQVQDIDRHEVVFLDGARHFVMLDAEPSYLKKLDAFLREHVVEATP